MMKNKLIFAFLIISVIQAFSKDFDLFDLRKNHVEIKADKYVLLTYGEMSCKQCYGQLVYAISKIDSTIPVYCITENEEDMMRRKNSYGMAKNYSGLKTYFYLGPDHLIFRYSPNVLIIENDFQTYTKLRSKE